MHNAGKWACDRLIEDADFGKKIFFSDDAHFDLGGYVISKIAPFGAQKKRTHTLKRRFKSRGIIGPLFFENVQEGAVTVNGDRYRAMFNEFFFTKIEEEDIDNIWLALRAT